MFALIWGKFAPSLLAGAPSPAEAHLKLRRIEIGFRRRPAPRRCPAEAGRKRSGAPSRGSGARACAPAPTPCRPCRMPTQTIRSAAQTTLPDEWACLLTQTACK